MTTSRMGIIGNFLVSNFSLAVVTGSPERGLLNLSLLPCFLHHSERSAFLLYHLSCNFEFLYFLLARQVIHQFEHKFFQNHPEATGTHLPGHRLASHGAKSLVIKLETDVFKLE